jgi:small subunit ribosomal protein S9
MPQVQFYGTGRRKSAVARVRVLPGTGSITVNKREMGIYFHRPSLRLLVERPLVVANYLDKLDIRILVDGGGLMGQAGAVRLGIARALCAMDLSLRPSLKAEGLLRRDPREKERKKYGQRGARARFQFSKR